MHLDVFGCCSGGQKAVGHLCDEVKKHSLALAVSTTLAIRYSFIFLCCVPPVLTDDVSGQVNSELIGLFQ